MPWALVVRAASANLIGRNWDVTRLCLVTSGSVTAYVGSLFLFCTGRLINTNGITTGKNWPLRIKKLPTYAAAGSHDNAKDKGVSFGGAVQTFRQSKTVSSVKSLSDRDLKILFAVR